MLPELEIVRTAIQDACMKGLRHITLEYVLARQRRGDVTTATATRQRHILGTFADSYGNRSPSVMSRRDVERWLATRGHLAAGTRRNEFSTVRAFIRYLVREGIVKRDPVAEMKAPRVPRSAGRALSRDETEALERVLPDSRARAIYALMRWMGMRRCEVLNLEVGDWDRRSETLHIRGKGGHERVEPVPTWVGAALLVYLTDIGVRAGPMIRTQNGQRGISNSYLGRMMSTWMNDAGIKRRALDGRGCHSLRHTIASELLETGADVRVVQDLLGHQSLTSTQIYLRRAGTSRIREALQAAKDAAA